MTERKEPHTPRYPAMTPEELEFIRTHAPVSRVALHAAFQARFNRPEIGAFTIYSARKRNGWLWPRNAGRKQPVKLKLADYTDARGNIVEKVRELEPSGRYRFRHYRKQRLLWEKENGPIPKGYVLKAKGSRANFDPSNWILMPIGVASRIKTPELPEFNALPEDIQTSLVGVARLRHALAKAKNPSE